MYCILLHNLIPWGPFVHVHCTYQILQCLMLFSSDLQVIVLYYMCILVCINTCICCPYKGSLCHMVWLGVGKKKDNLTCRQILQYSLLKACHTYMYVFLYCDIQTSTTTCTKCTSQNVLLRSTIWSSLCIDSSSVYVTTHVVTKHGFLLQIAPFLKH